MADSQTFWALDFWATGFWADDFWAGGTTPAPVVTRDGGGMRVRRKPPVPGWDASKTVPVDGTLYNAMFPPKPSVFPPRVHKSPAEPVEAPPDLAAILSAWLAFEDDE